MKRESFNEVLKKWGDMAKKDFNSPLQFGPEWLSNEKPTELTEIIDCEE